MTWPFQYDNDRLAEMFNSTCSTVIAAALIFVFVYFNRKKPIFKSGKAGFSIGRNGASQLISDPVNYINRISFEIENDSIYTAYNVRITKIDQVFPSRVELSNVAQNIPSNEKMPFSFIHYFSIPISEVMKQQPVSWNQDKEYLRSLEAKYKVPFYIYISYRNDDNRKIRKKLLITY